MKAFLQHDLEIVFRPWVTKFVHSQFLRLGTFLIRRRLEGKDDFAACQPMISATVRTEHHSGAGEGGVQGTNSEEQNANS